MVANEKHQAWMLCKGTRSPPQGLLLLSLFLPMLYVTGGSELLQLTPALGTLFRNFICLGGTRSLEEDLQRKSLSSYIYWWNLAPSSRGNLGSKKPLSKEWKRGGKNERDIKVPLSFCLTKAALISFMLLQDIFDVNHKSHWLLGIHIYMNPSLSHAFSSQSSLYFHMLLQKEESTWGNFLVMSPGCSWWQGFSFCSRQTSFLVFLNMAVKLHSLLWDLLGHL